MKQLRTLASALCIGSILTTGVAVAEGPVAWCTFDSALGSVVADRAADRDDRVEGSRSKQCLHAAPIFAASTLGPRST